MSDQLLGEPIAKGRTADIYAWEKGRVLKLFHAWFSPQDVEYEARIARAVQSTGLRVPKVGEIVEIDGRLGLAYERLNGVSQLDEMRAKPWTAGKHSRLLAELHAKIHATPAPNGFPRLKDKLARKIRKVTGIQDDVREALLEALNQLPDGNRFCHGDFHPGNVILTASGPFVIDWIDASAGAPMADVARTSVLIQGEIGSQGLTNVFERLIFGWGHRVYLKRCFQFGSERDKEHSTWLPVVAAARMSEGIEELAPWLRSQAESIMMRRVD